MWDRSKRMQVLELLNITVHANGNFSDSKGNRLAISFTPDGRVLVRGVCELTFKEIYRLA